MNKNNSLRPDGRSRDQIRPLRFTPDFIDYPEGSVLVEMGKTRVLCNVSLEESVPRWMVGSGSGWLTAEYALLPRATHTRTARETKGLRGRTQEIRRLIGRSLRAAVNLDLLGERTMLVDCDVLQADGGTRTASITGAYVAVAIALQRLSGRVDLPSGTLQDPIAAISVGIVNGQPCLDLCYEEDSAADVDLNVIMDSHGRFIEVQGTAEGRPFDRSALNEMLDLAAGGISQLIEGQRKALKLVS